MLLGHTAEGDQNDGELTPRNLRECEAEAVALLCCAALDLPGVEFCRGYIQSWWGAGQSDPGALGAAHPEGGRSDPEGRHERETRGGRHEGRHLRARQHPRPGAGEPAAGTPALRRGARLDGGRVRRSRASAGRRIVGPRSTSCWPMPSAGGSTCWCAGGSIGSGATCKHLITLLEELQALGVAFVSLAEGIDATTPAGKLQMHILGAIAEFERERIRERVLAGLSGPRRKEAARPTKESSGLDRVPGGNVRAAAKRGACRRARRLGGLARAVGRHWATSRNNHHRLHSPPSSLMIRPNLSNEDHANQVNARVDGACHSDAAEIATFRLPCSIMRR